MPLVDARRLDPATRLHADLCIVGAGAAGITLARDFIGTGVEVVLLESGGEHFAHRSQLLYRGENLGVANHATTHSRFRMFGGSTTRWAGQCRPLDPIDFEARDWLPGSSWPFGYDALEPWYRRATGVCSLARPEFAASAWLADGGALPAGGDGLDPVIFQFSHDKDFAAAYRRELEAAANVRVVLNASVVDLEADPAMRRLRAVEGRTFNGRALRIEARACVLACGGIENARLLLASNRVAAAGLGNGHDLVGRFFQDHPYLMTGYFVPSRPEYDRGLHVIESFKRVGRAQPAHSGFALSERLRRAERLSGCVAYFIRRPFAETAPDYFAPGGQAVAHLLDVLRHKKVPDRRFGRHLANAVRDCGAAGRTLARHAGEIVRRNRCLALRTVLETTPRADSRVTLSDRRDRFGMPRVRVDWRIDQGDLRALTRLRALLAETVRVRGLGVLVDDPACDADGWPNSMEGGKHHMGTTRMHADPALGVVDPDCRVHGFANLYVAGSSVFPTAGYANPTLTIVALALRLAEHLKADLAGPRST